MQEPFSQQHQPSQGDKPSQDSRRDSSQIHGGIESHLQPLMNYQERVEATKQQLSTLMESSKNFETLTFGRITLSEHGSSIIIWGKSLKDATTGGFLAIGNNRETSGLLLENALYARFSGKQLSASEQLLLETFDEAERDLSLTERICQELLRSERLNSIQ